MKLNSTLKNDPGAPKQIWTAIAGLLLSSGVAAVPVTVDFSGQFLPRPTSDLFAGTAFETGGAYSGQFSYESDVAPIFSQSGTEFTPAIKTYLLSDFSFDFGSASYDGTDMYVSVTSSPTPNNYSLQFGTSDISADQTSGFPPLDDIRVSMRLTASGAASRGTSLPLDLDRSQFDSSSPGTESSMLHGAALFISARNTPVSPDFFGVSATVDTLTSTRPPTEIETLNAALENGTYTNSAGTTLLVPFRTPFNLDQVLQVGVGGQLNNGGVLDNEYNIHNDGTILNTGTIENNGFFLSSSGSTLTNDGLFNNDDGLLNIASGAIMDGGGTLNQSAGALTVNGTVTQTVNINGGTLSGAGTINGDLFLGNEAQFLPGNSPGTFVVNGDFIVDPGAILRLEIDDVIEVNGALNIADGIVIELLFGDQPVPTAIVLSDYFDVSGLITVGDVIGDINPNLINLTVFSSVPNTASTVSVDVFGGGQQSAQVQVSSSAVPEPGTTALLVLGLLGAGFARKRRTH